MGISNFNTNRFIEITTPRQIENGTIMFMDSENPGIYYSACKNGNVNRIIKTCEQTITNQENNTTLTDTRLRTVYNRVNYRNPNNGKYVPLFRVNDQLRRIQHVANNYKRDLVNVNYQNQKTILTIPR